MTPAGPRIREEGLWSDPAQDIQDTTVLPNVYNTR